MDDIGLDTPLEDVLGKRDAQQLAKQLDVTTVAGMLEHYPRRYARRGEMTAIESLPLGEHVTLVARVLRVNERQMRARRGSIVEVEITDEKGIVSLTFFNQSWRAKQLQPGVTGIFSGKASAYRGAIQLAHPEYELFENAPLEALSERRDQWLKEPIPIYPATASLPTWKVAAAVQAVLDAVPFLRDPVPVETRAMFGMYSYDEAMRAIHQPETFKLLERARESLRFTEAYVLQAALLQRRAISELVAARARTDAVGPMLEAFDRLVPFELTPDQKTVGRQIAKDLARGVPMHRLVQGEVGSGKTLVALRAMLQVADAGGQSAMLAPTEVLASQHHRSIIESLGPELSAQLMPTLITGSMTKTERKRAALRVVAGEAKIVVGTHALLSDDVMFDDLGLVIVDEQHRFGVEQRESLRAKGAQPPHLLVLTATPIPRTVAMTVFGDLDISSIVTMPKGRQKIETFVVATREHPHWLERAWQRVAEEVDRGRQAFVVCPAIEPAEPAEPVDGEEPAQPVTAVMELAPTLAVHPLFAGKRVAAVHGAMPSDEKDAAMRAFAEGKIDVLVATTVIEVGVNVPNASVMIVMDADRFGVSQLHQLRGRVGRGEHAGLCLLVSNTEEESTARERINAVAETLDGFELAERDLELRREGDVLGTAQSGGRTSLKLLRVIEDTELIRSARDEAALLIDDDWSLKRWPDLKAAIGRHSFEEREFLGKS
ncbi:ATP-dependent DNA helicase RecG [Pseudoclavibacter sp. RFBI5]|uniref:ATP-dependent DNA helicase RecG n=1 Tax=Pseudoclavibacter sp. RFBI5 TaxID=2080578 RepID=UPI000CE874AA|nr:ATP-dependent DNA helicase RecG [Pseudoclavibacter sp. RFBI5]PPG04187.1 ATP-dependent DNA helicase RecG [Pseudoclavibacter sp. RFBI5]